MKKKIILFSAILILAISLLFVALYFWQKQKLGLVSPLSSPKEPVIKEKPLDKYSFENLRTRQAKESEIILEHVLKEEEKFTAYLFSYQSEGKKITGLAHLPKKNSLSPVVVMLRGYVDPAIYQTGVGTVRAGEVFAQNGFITLAPDYLGYGSSDMPPDNVWEERFLRVVSVMDLLASVKRLPQAETQNIFLWGHSNGGLTALSVLAITSAQYPTTLWAPVSQFFPYDILYYIYESEDNGKALRKSLAEFENDYDTDKYSFSQYLSWIQAPILLHQGDSDPYIPLFWSQNLVDKLKKEEKEVTFYIYPGADHNLKGSWEKVVERDLRFFKGHMRENL